MRELGAIPRREVVEEDKAKDDEPEKEGVAQTPAAKRRRRRTLPRVGELTSNMKESIDLEAKRKREERKKKARKTRPREKGA